MKCKGESSILASKEQGKREGVACQPVGIIGDRQGQCASQYSKPALVAQSTLLASIVALGQARQQTRTGITYLQVVIPYSLVLSKLSEAILSNSSLRYIGVAIGTIAIVNIEAEVAKEGSVELLKGLGYQVGLYILDNRAGYIGLALLLQLEVPIVVYKDRQHDSKGLASTDIVSEDSAIDRAIYLLDNLYSRDNLIGYKLELGASSGQGDALLAKTLLASQLLLASTQQLQHLGLQDRQQLQRIDKVTSNSSVVQQLNNLAIGLLDKGYIALDLYKGQGQALLVKQIGPSILSKQYIKYILDILGDNIDIALQKAGIQERQDIGSYVDRQRQYLNIAFIQVVSNSLLLQNKILIGTYKQGTYLERNYILVLSITPIQEYLEAAVVDTSKERRYLGIDLLKLYSDIKQLGLLQEGDEGFIYYILAIYSSNLKDREQGRSEVTTQDVDNLIVALVEIVDSKDSTEPVVGIVAKVIQYPLLLQILLETQGQGRIVYYIGELEDIKGSQEYTIQDVDLSDRLQADIAVKDREWLWVGILQQGKQVEQDIGLAPELGGSGGDRRLQREAIILALLDIRDKDANKIGNYIDYQQGPRQRSGKVRYTSWHRKEHCQTRPSAPAGIEKSAARLGLVRRPV